MKTTNFVSIKTVLSDVIDTIDERYITNSDVLEWASKALGQMGCIEFYHPFVKFLRVDNYETYLPKGTIQVNQILYKTDFQLSNYDMSELSSLVDEDDFNKVYKNFELKYAERNSYLTNKWQPLRASTNNFMLSVLCDNSPNLLAGCNEEFTILPNGKIATSFKSGWIIVSMFRANIDENGDYLILEDDELIEALRFYVLYRLWEKRWNMKEDGSDTRFTYYKSQWGLYKNMVRGKMKLLTEDQYQNIIEYSNSLLPKTKRYYNYFGTLGSADKTFF